MADCHFPAANRHEEKLTAELQRSLSTVKPALLRLAESLTEIHTRDPFTSVIVEERSGHFTGVFVAEALGFHKSGRVFFAHPKPAVARSGSSLEAETAFITANCGRHPLIVTEAILSGNTAAAWLTSFFAQGISPSYASLTYELRGWDLLDQKLLAVPDRHDPGAPRLRRVVRGVGLAYVLNPKPVCSALNAIPVPDYGVSLLSESAQDRWLAETSDSDELSSRMRVIEIAQTELTALLAEFRARQMGSNTPVA